MKQSNAENPDLLLSLILQHRERDKIVREGNLLQNDCSEFCHW